MSTFLNSHQIAQLAQSALDSHMVSAKWNKEEISDDCFEWFGFVPSKPLILLVITRAKMGYMSVNIQAKSTTNT